MPARTPGEPDDTERVLSGSGGGGWCRRYSDAWPPTSRAPMWRKSLCLGGDTTGARWVKQHLTHVCTSVGTPSPERVEGTRAWCEKADESESQRARGQSARSCMVKADCLNPSRGGTGAALRARDWSLSSMWRRMLLLRGQAPVEASPYGTGNNVRDTYSTNRGFYSNLGITYVPRGIG